MRKADEIFDTILGVFAIAKTRRSRPTRPRTISPSSAFARWARWSGPGRSGRTNELTRERADSDRVRSRRLRDEGESSSARSARSASTCRTSARTAPSPRTIRTTRIRWREQVSNGEVKRGVLMCGTGLGMSYAANRHPHVRAAVAWTPEIATLAREHNDANVLVLPARSCRKSTASRFSRPGSRHRSKAAATSGGSRRSSTEATHESTMTRLDDIAPLSLARCGAREADPEIAALIDEETRAAEGRARADRQRELRLAGRARGDGLAAQQQVRRGTAGKALLRRLRGRRQGRTACDRSREAIVRRRARERAAALRRAGELRRDVSPFLKPGDTVLGMDLSHGGHLTHGSPVNFSGMLYQRHLVRRDRRRPASTTTTCAQGARAQAEDDHRRRTARTRA